MLWLCRRRLGGFTGRSARVLLADRTGMPRNRAECGDGIRLTGDSSSPSFTSFTSFNDDLRCIDIYDFLNRDPVRLFVSGMSHSSLASLLIAEH